MIELKNITKVYDNNIILDHINLKLNKGHIYGIVGRNGSGKSLLLKIICGFAKPTNGRVIYNGTDIYEKNIFLPNTRALINGPGFIEDISGFKNLSLLASINNNISNDDIESFLKMLDLYKEKDKPYKKYSLGTKQKLGIVQVLMEYPDILIFDEPFNGLDDESIQIIRDILLKLKRQNKIIIIATHIKEDIDVLCDVVYKINSGKISTIK